MDHGVGLQRAGTPVSHFSEAARRWGCSTASVHRWQAAATPLDPAVSLRMELGEDESKRLRKENARLKMEIENKENEVAINFGDFWLLMLFSLKNEV